jgi:integrase/recombinase XerD
VKSVDGRESGEVAVVRGERGTGCAVTLPAKLVPAILQRAGERASRRFLEFFGVTIENDNTRKAYLHAARDFFGWCEVRGLALEQIEPLVVASYFDQLKRRKIKGRPPEATTIKQHLAAIRCLFDWLVVGQVLPVNPAASVRGPKYVTQRGKTPVLEGEDAGRLLDSIKTLADEGGPDVKGLRDRALIAVMVYTFGRIGAVLGLRKGDYYPNGKRWWVRLNEKGGKLIEVPVHHEAEEYLDEYLAVAGYGETGEVFRSFDRKGKLTDKALLPVNALRMVKRRAVAAGLLESTCCHTFRATGITAYLTNGGSLEKAQYIAGHASVCTTKLYDRRSEVVSVSEIERMVLRGGSGRLEGK